MIEKIQKHLGRMLASNRRHPIVPAVHEAAVMHLDIVGSTRLVQQDLELAHRRIRQLYLRLERLCERHDGVIRELRGDAAVIEFESAADAVRAAIAIHQTHQLLNRTRVGKISPDIRTGISFGPLIVEDKIVTGQAVIRAQRLEQLAAPGEVLFDGSIRDRIAESEGFAIENLGWRELKGFAESVATYRVHPQCDGHGWSGQGSLPSLLGAGCA